MRLILHCSVLSTIALTPSFALAQSAPAPLSQSHICPVERLESHAGQTRFQLGDPITVDLVLTSDVPGYRADTDIHPANSLHDIVDVAPGEGWSRIRDIGPSFFASADLGAQPVRIPVLVNRTIVFETPGHYDISLITNRLFFADRRDVASGACDQIPPTNSVGIDIEPRTAQEESALVLLLSNVISNRPELDKPPDQLFDEASSGSEAALSRLSLFITESVKKQENARTGRHTAALRLAYLTGDDALRAKVHFLLTEDPGNGEGIDLLILNGIASSRNIPLQLDLLQSAWTDPQRIPSSLLQSALEQTTTLEQHRVIPDKSTLFTFTPGAAEPQRLEFIQEHQRELSQIVATLPGRSGSSLEKTIQFLLTDNIGLPDAEKARVRAIAARDLPSPTPVSQAKPHDR